VSIRGIEVGARWSRTCSSCWPTECTTRQTTREAAEHWSPGGGRPRCVARPESDSCSACDDACAVVATAAAEAPACLPKRPLLTSANSRVVRAQGATGGTLRGARYQYRDSALMLEPSSSSVLYWNVVLVLLILFTSTVTPYEVSFLDLQPAEPFYWVVVVVDVAFFVDMLVMCNTVVYDEHSQRTISSRTRVVGLYLRQFFFIDLISVLPFDEVVLAATAAKRTEVQALRIIRLLKLLRILRMSRIFEQLESMLSIRYGVVKLWRNLVTVMLVCHWMGCFYHLVAVLTNQKCNWINGYFGVSPCHQVVPYPDNIERYIAALYLATYTVATVGYGDVLPTNSSERIFLIIAMIVGAGLFAYVVGNICDVLLSLSVRDNEFQKLMDTANAFIRDSDLPPELSIRVRSFLRNRRLARTQQEMNEFMEHLSPALRAEVALELNRDRLNHVGFFNGAPKGMLVQLALMMNLECYPALETVITDSEPADRMFIIKRGLVSIRGIVRGKDDVVGEDMMYRTAGPRGYTVATLMFSELLLLRRDHLLGVLQDFPEAAAALRRRMIRAILREKLIEFHAICRRTRERLASETLRPAAKQLMQPTAAALTSLSMVSSSLLTSSVRHLGRCLTDIRRQETCPFAVALLAVALCSPVLEATAHRVAVLIQRAWRDCRRRMRLRAEVQRRNAQRRADLDAQRKAAEEERQRERDAAPVMGLLGTERVVIVYGPAPLAAEQLRAAVEQLQATVAELQKQVTMTRNGRSHPGIEAAAKLSNPRARAPELRGPEPYR
jgi:CRP-like cAMP-binding protein